MNIKILVATHREYWLPKSDIYMPVHVGSALSNLNLGIQRDDEGENISAKNPNYCELTGIYWGWKNLDADYVGLVHYRRYLADRRPRPGEDVKNCILSESVAKKLLAETDVLLPRKRHYFIETMFSHYEHTHEGEHLRKTRQVIEEYSPEYLPAFDVMLQRKSAHMFNMFLMKKEKYDAYCQWLFPILHEMEGYVDVSQMTAYEARYMGRISELLLDVWLETNQISYKEVPFVQLGKTNWPKKIGNFLAAKFRHEKYKQSF